MILNEIFAYKFTSNNTERPLLIGLDNVRSTGFYKVYGWAFDLRPFLNTYLYQQYGSWREAKAPNKTLLRKSIYGRIDKIILIAKKEGVTL